MGDIEKVPLCSSKLKGVVGDYQWRSSFKELKDLWIKGIYVLFSLNIAMCLTKPFPLNDIYQAFKDLS